jgi:hypothetical protein
MHQRGIRIVTREVLSRDQAAVLSSAFLTVLLECV